jgi:hypothetical protein
MEVRDPIYCFEIARRSVGRAALHLGIEGMTEEALDVMADVLLEYLGRLGNTLSHLVEASGRTSAHVNLLDTFQACQVVASPAVQRLHLVAPGSEDLFGKSTQAQQQQQQQQHNSNAIDQPSSSSWQGLASFCFGAKWQEEKQPVMNQPAGGKRGPSSTATAQTEGGWEAPYLDEVPPFPQAGDTCANPHPMPPHVGLSLHNDIDSDDDVQTILDEEEQQNKTIPDAAFTNNWGSLKRKSDGMEIDDDNNNNNNMSAAATSSEPPTKKVKLADKKNQDGDDEDGDEDDDEDKGEEEKQQPEEEEAAKPANIVPSFYPPAPTTNKLVVAQGRTIVDGVKGVVTSNPAAAAAAVPPAVDSKTLHSSEIAHGVRSSLVQLGQYWGSGWDADPKDKTSKLAVPLGRSEGEHSTAIVPLGRASGSRVSRILEGSMDAAAMQ